MSDMIVVLNYSDEFTMETVRRLRAEQVLGRIVSGTTTAEQIRRMEPRGVILCGEPRSGAGVFDASILELGLPVLALGHASHMLLAALGGACVGIALQDKKASLKLEKSPLFAGLYGSEHEVQEALTLMLPPDVQMIASAAGCTIAFAREERKLYGIQIQLERNDPEGTAMLKNFARDICGCSAWWTEAACQQEAESSLADAVSRGGFAVCAVSGGIDSTVAAVLTHRAFGERMTALFVDNGLMREDEGAQVQQMYEQLGIPLLRVDRSGVVLEALRGKRGMEEKREVVVACLHDEILRQAASKSGADTLVLGTNYSDYLTGGSAMTRWQNSGLTVVEPLLNLFKHEVRSIAALLGLPEEIAGRKPFPALGLGARIVGEITSERLYALRVAEAIFGEEIAAAGLERKLYKYFPILVGGSPAMSGEMLVLRAVGLSGGMLIPARLPYDLVERTVTRILEQAPLITRVFSDQTPTKLGRETFG